MVVEFKPNPKSESIESSSQSDASFPKRLELEPQTTLVAYTAPDNDNYEVKGVKFKSEDVKEAIKNLESLIPWKIPILGIKLSPGAIVVGTDTRIDNHVESKFAHPLAAETRLVANYLRTQGIKEDLPSVDSKERVTFTESQIVKLQQNLGVEQDGIFSEATAKKFLERLVEEKIIKK